MKIDDIKLISDTNLAELSQALDHTVKELSDTLGDERLRSDMYVYLLQASVLIGDAYLMREADKAIANGNQVLAKTRLMTK